jgi:hypothetical protein
MTYSRLQLSSIVLLLTTLAFLGPGKALAQDATVAIVQEAVTHAGLNGIQVPVVQTATSPEQAGRLSDNSSTTSVAWTTSILIDVMLLMAAVVFASAAIVRTIWPPTHGRTKLLTVTPSGPKPHSSDRRRASSAGSA